MINWQTVAQIFSIGLIGLAGPLIIIAISFKGGANL
uniref:Ycf12 n=2 Tax=Pavlovaceae TaxID=418969 RepID=M1KFZ5_DIALT|nr:Ycf12 [Diacronema lutheri]YP_009863849.1 photosystem II protein Ycf12 [Pavlova sp. NIVA-4/92]AGE93830.1 Ycf12 [Diacronema lutheri]QKE31180.1 photosystem II protein Ycf12 [Pavlova sp. NIVA-4/92]